MKLGSDSVGLSRINPNLKGFSMTLTVGSLTIGGLFPFSLREKAGMRGKCTYKSHRSCGTGGSHLSKFDSRIFIPPSSHTLKNLRWALPIEPKKSPISLTENSVNSFETFRV